MLKAMAVTQEKSPADHTHRTLSASNILCGWDWLTEPHTLYTISQLVSQILNDPRLSRYVLSSKVGTIRGAIAAIYEVLPVSHTTSLLRLAEGVPATFAGFEVGLDLEARCLLGATCRIEFHLKPPFAVLVLVI